ncbi:MAG: phytoene desaturase family protein [Lentimonas sp.]
MANTTVIGGGFGGIAAALRLRAKGHEVTLVDRCSQLGGRAQVFERDGFRHDAGPTVITAPFLFDELFDLFGKKRSDYVDFIPLDVWYRFHYHDGREFDYGGTVEDTLQGIRAFDPRDCDGYQNLLAHSKRIFDVGFTELADQPFHSPATLIKQVPAMMRLGCYRTVWQLVSKYLKNDHLRRAFSIHPLLVGGNPFETTSIYSLIHFLERKWGIHFASGGTGAIVNALEKLMIESGIEIRKNSTVTSIDVNGRKARGVRLQDGDAFDTDMIVSNTDPLHLYSNMLPASKQSLGFRTKQKRMKQSMGLYVLFFGTDRQYPQVAHHTIWLAERFKELIHEIFHGDRLPDDFSLYLHRPTATDPSFAPTGKDSFYVLAPVPNMQADINWSIEGPRLRDRIVDALDRTILPGLNQTIRSDFFMTPEDFAHDYLSSHGSGFSVAPIFSQSAWFRFHNRSEALENLYLVGAGTHPGAGVPGVLCSAKVLDRITTDA